MFITNILDQYHFKNKWNGQIETLKMIQNQLIQGQILDNKWQVHIIKNINKNIGTYFLLKTKL